MSQFEPPIHWNDYEDIALKLYERFGDDFNEEEKFTGSVSLICWSGYCKFPALPVPERKATKAIWK